MVEEMRRRHRHIEVARLLDGLAVVHRLGHGELPGAVLQQTGDAVDVFGALLAGHLAPDALLGLLRGGDRRHPRRRAAERHLGDFRLVGGIDGVEILAGGRCDKLAADEEFVAGLELRIGRLGGGIVFPQVAEDELGGGPAQGAVGGADGFLVSQSGHFNQQMNTDAHEESSGNAV
jgi:hypothetical protein